MSVTELEVRLASLEDKLARLANKVESTGSEQMNAWIDKIHGTFQNDASYRQASRLGSEWRKSYRRPAAARSRKAAKK